MEEKGDWEYLEFDWKTRADQAHTMIGVNEETAELIWSLNLGNQSEEDVKARLEMQRENMENEEHSAINEENSYGELVRRVKDLLGDYHDVRFGHSLETTDDLTAIKYDDTETTIESYIIDYGEEGIEGIELEDRWDVSDPEIIGREIGRFATF
jgi:hypothetical protein